MKSTDFTTEDYDNATSNFYTAAVLEFNPSEGNFLNGKDKIDARLREYVRWIYEAKDYDVDILAFPEATLNYHGK